MQRAALTELGGLLNAAAEGCALGEALNRAVFYVAAQVIWNAVWSIKVDRPAVGNTFYIRSAKALEELSSLPTTLTATKDSVTATPAQELSQGLSTASGKTIVLTADWPTGQAQAGKQPADRTVVFDVHAYPDLTTPQDKMGMCFGGLSQ